MGYVRWMYGLSFDDLTCYRPEEVESRKENDKGGNDETDEGGMNDSRNYTGPIPTTRTRPTYERHFFRNNYTGSVKQNLPLANGV